MKRTLLAVVFYCGFSVMPLYAAGPGQLCGGFANARCEAGSECQLWPGSDAGICVALAGPGEICGGFANVKCKEGLKCKLWQGADAGLCIVSREAGPGEMCGGFAGIPVSYTHLTLPTNREV